MQEFDTATTATDTPVLSFKALTKCYTAPLFQDFNLTLPKGRIIGLLGPNGSGKTTLIKLAAGILSPNAGEIRICGHLPGKEAKSLVSYLPERNALPDWMSAEALIRLFTDFFADFDPERASMMLSELGVDMKARIRHLSKGTKEKVQLVLAMSRRARLYLLDEPIGGVDPATRDYILKTVISAYHSEATVLISTHLIADVEPYLDDFLFLLGGRVVRSGNVKEYTTALGTSLDESFRRDFRC